ncbi:helix-turn-helix transcriptional regulator [Saccharopolyspora gregorii]|uniref:Helix-turn-helix transcriptional regulator n=1 Tax=Saccharopolyspora gregorii TaxID=33914 RepID=A0ABP6RMF5_9PSEU
MATTPKARALGIAVRKIRQERGLTLRELGERIGRHSGEISRWENGERPLTPERVAQILGALDVNGTRFQEIVSLAYETKNPPWVATALPEREQQLSALIDFEQAATRITEVSPLLVPGLLQEAGYIRSIMGAGGVPSSEVSARVALRLGRREVLTRTDPVTMRAFLGEAVLHQIVGDAGTMAAQLRHLVDSARRPNVELRVVPFRSGWQPALEGAFTLLESEVSTPIVQLENRRSTLFLHEDDDIRAYRQAVDHLDDIALGAAETSRAMTRRIQSLERM